MTDNFDGIDQLQFPEEFNIEREILAKIISLPVPPDGGWGWAIVCSSFIFNTIVDGILGAVGVLVPSIQTSFDLSLFMASLIISILYSFTYALGPFVGYFFDRFGVRPICLACSILASASFFCSYYAPSFQVLFFTLGFMGGAALCTLSLSAQVMVGFYFDKRRPIALSISSLGSSFGSSIFPIILSACIRNFGWHDTLFTLAGIASLSIPASLVMRPLSPPKLVNQREPSIESLSNDSNISVINGISCQSQPQKSIKIHHYSIPDVRSNNYPSNKENNKEKLIDALIVCKNKVVKPDISEGNLSYLTSSTHTHRGSTYSNIRGIHRESKNVPDLVNRLIQLIEYKIGKGIDARFSSSEGDIFRTKYDINKQSEGVTQQARELIMKWINKIYSSPFNKMELLHTNSRHSLAEKGFISDEHDLWSLLNIPTIEDVVQGRGISKILFNSAIFKSPFILIYYVASFLMFCVVLIPYIFMIQLTQDYCKHGDVLISLLGVGGMVSRLASGFIIEKAGVDVFKFNECGFYLMFISLLLMPIMRVSFGGMAIVCISYGLSYGTVFYTPPLIFCNTLGIQKLTASLSIQMFIKGIGYIVGIIGFGKSIESVGITNAFYIGSGIIFLSATMQAVRHLRLSIPKNPSELARISQ